MKYKIGEKVVYCWLSYEDDEKAQWYMKNEGVILDSIKGKCLVRWKKVPQWVVGFFLDEANNDTILTDNAIYILMDVECICTKAEALLRKI